MASGEKQYHIEGLRGLAIILIILFHMNAQWFPKGYLGVDIFLVISGYLLFLRPIQREGQTKLQASWGFVRRKCGRLMQPLSVAVIVTLAVGFFMLVPGDLVATAKTARSALLGASNIYLSNLKNGGYFAPDASFNLMVPTWYLSLICQVYLLFLAGWLLIPGKWMKAVVAVGIVLSLIYANMETVEVWWQALTGHELKFFSRMPGYYSFGTRIWEVLAGGIICVLPGIRSKWGSCLVGLASLAAVLFLLFVPFEDEEGSLDTLLIVAATVLCIRYAGEGLAKTCLTNPVTLWFGKISFSIYLIHMAVVTSMVCYFCTLDAITLPVTFVLAVAAGYLFYFAVEKRRYPLYLSIGLWVVALAASIVLAKPKLKLNDFVWKDAPLEEKAFTDWHFPKDQSLFTEFDGKVLTQKFGTISRISCSNAEYKEHMVLLGGKDDAKPTFVLLGDSHAAALFSGLDAFCRRHGVSGVYLTTYVTSMCDWEYTSPDFSWDPDKTKALMHWLKAHPEIDTIVLGQRWYLRMTTLQSYKFHSLCGDEAPEAIRKFVTELKKTGKRVVVVTSAPELKTRVPMRSYRFYKRFGAQAHLDNLRYTEEEYNDRLKFCNDFLLSMEKEGLCDVLHIETALFKDGVFDVYQDGDSLMIDANHISPSGSEKAIQGCDARLQELLTQPQ